MSIEDLHQNDLILLECLSGSKAYGLDTPQSDTDIKGVFLLPRRDFYGLQYVPQVSNPTNDIVFYEFGRFMELLALNNPNILELLGTPAESVISRRWPFESLQMHEILSKRCKDTFGKFAMSQIKKAKGLNKKIMTPVDQARKTPLAFCFVNHVNGSIPVQKFLELNNWKQEHCGLVNIPNMKDVYGLYHSESIPYAGIIRSPQSNDIALSNVPKGANQIALLYFNRDGYSTYCKDYREYWEWVENRNDVRYENTQSHGKNYDAKNMMHTFRLLHMAIEIAEQQQIIVRRPDRSFLLDIKSGKYEYAELLDLAHEKQQQMEAAFDRSDLPEHPNLEYIRDWTIAARERYYGESPTFSTPSPS